MKPNNDFKVPALVVAGSLSLILVGCPSPSANPVTSTAKTLNELTHVKVGTGPHGLAFAGGFVVNDNPGSGDVNLIDPATNQVVQTLPMPTTGAGINSAPAPSYTKATHDGNFAVHLDAGAESATSKNTVMRVINPATKAIAQTINLGAAPGSKFVWGDDHKAYVTVGSAPSNNVVLVDFSSDFTAAPATTSISVDRTGATSFTAGFLAAKGGFLAVPNAPDNSVSFVALDAAGQPTGGVTSLTYGNNPGPIDISTYGGKAILVYGNKNSNTAVLYDMNAKSLIKVLDVGSAPTDVVTRADGRYAYMTCKGSGQVAIIDCADGSLVGLTGVGRGLSDKTPNPVHIYDAPGVNGSTEQVWVADDGDDSVTVLNATTNTVSAVVQVGVGHHKMAFSADGTRAYVSNITDGTVSVIDRTAIK